MPLTRDWLVNEIANVKTQKGKALEHAMKCDGALLGLEEALRLWDMPAAVPASPEPEGVVMEKTL